MPAGLVGVVAFLALMHWFAYTEGFRRGYWLSTAVTEPTDLASLMTIIQCVGDHQGPDWDVHVESLHAELKRGILRLETKVIPMERHYRFDQDLKATEAILNEAKELDERLRGLQERRHESF